MRDCTRSVIDVLLLTVLVTTAVVAEEKWSWSKGAGSDRDSQTADRRQSHANIRVDDNYNRLREAESTTAKPRPQNDFNEFG